MTTYVYRCRTCGQSFESNTRALTSCPYCLGRDLGRDYSSVQFGSSPFQPHFNHAVGEYVTSSQHFNDLLKVKGEENGHEFSRVDPGDIEPIRSHDDILDTQARTIYDRNIDPRRLVE